MSRRAQLINIVPVAAPVKLEPVQVPEGTTLVGKLILYSGNAFVTMNRDTEDIFLGAQVSNLGEHIKEISGRSGFKVQATLTKEYGKKVSSGRIDMLTYKILWGGKAHALNLFNNGKVTFTGGYPEGSTQIAETPRKILEIVFGRVPHFEIQNVTAQFEGDFEGNLTDIERTLRGEIKQHFVSWSAKGYSMRIYSRGTVQISGIRIQAQVATAGRVVSGLIAFLKRQGVVHDAVRVQRPTKTRPQNRKNNQIAPNVATRSTTCPKNRRPDPYKFGGRAPAGFYVGVNPQGQPCCYKIPQRKEYLKNKIVQRFQALGIRVPESTKQVFGIDINNSNKPENVSGNRNENMLFFNGPDGFKIGTRQATRYSLTRLLDIARRIGVAMNARGKSSKMSKANIAGAIRNWARNRGKLKNAGAPVKTNTNIRLGPRGRLASTFTKPQLIEQAHQIGIHLNISMTHKEMLEELRSRLA